MAARLPRVIFAILADGHKISANAKIDAFGLFDKFLVWGLPAGREFSLVVGLESLPAGESVFNIYVKNPKKRQRTVAKFQCGDATPLSTTQTAVRLVLSLDQPGVHQLGVGPTTGGPRSIRWLPFTVELQPWPELPTGERLEEILANPHSLKALRASLSCSECKRNFTFELSIDPQRKRQRGVRKFPTNGRFECPKCSAIQHLKDIEGQLRSHLANQGGSAEQ